MSSATPPAAPSSSTVWFGTAGQARGIYSAVLNTETGELSDVQLAAEMVNAGFQTVDSTGQYLYSLGQLPNTDYNVAAFRIGPDRRQLTPLGGVNTGGGKPTHLSLSQDERTLLLAHYGGGCIAAVPIGDTHELLPPTSLIHHQGNSVHPARQAEPHPHWIGVTPEGRFAMVPDLGLDQVVIYALDQQAHTLSPHGTASLTPGAGPRHLKVHPNGRWVYVINELDLTVTALNYDAAAGSLTPFQSAPTLSADQIKVPTSGSEIRIHPNGRFLYAGLRGHDAIAVFEIAPEDGLLHLVELEPVRGSWPRNFGLDPSGKWLVVACAQSSNATVFAVDTETGHLSFTGQVVAVPESICVEFLAH